jgi:hypothetical protein
VDTVEWGSGATPAQAPAQPPAQAPAQPPAGASHQPSVGRALARIGGRWTALVVGALGLAALVASELLPWVKVHMGATSVPGANAPIDLGGDTSLDLDRLNTIGVFAYDLGILAVLALVGAVLFGPTAHRRSLFGFAVGLIAAQALNLAGLIHSFGHLVDSGVSSSRLPGGFHSSVEPGAYFAIIGLLLGLASVLLAAAPERVRTRLADVVGEPVDAEFTDEPIELTVTQAKPIDEAYYRRPDLHHR